ncbi:MAG: LuxR C-terminal-related transcriptional regulator [Novosphingobium sp.]|uniref:response regulator transcription factor n=1 Tax=Novosphingobium sp. TaxID=1874826 RepID=UPI00301B131E
MAPDEVRPFHGTRAVIAMVGDEEEVVERVLGCGRFQPMRCVVYTDSLKAKRAADLVRRGVADLLDWPCREIDMADAILTATAGLSVLMDDSQRVASARRRIESLSRREREVLAGVLAGHTSREIAETLGLSRRTVEVHRLNLVRRLGVENSVEAVRLAIDSGCFLPMA